MVKEAVQKGFLRYGLSEHMPRYNGSHLYPEERDMSISDLESQFSQFVLEARRLQQVYKSQIELFVGLETEYCDDSYLAKSMDLVFEHKLDYSVGSVHHVLGIPIDFSLELYDVAEKAAGSTENLFIAYFEMMEKMIQSIKPTVIGHFDLIRMFRPQQQITMAILDAARKAAKAGVANNCLFEINSSAIRKGLPNPYPQADILQMIKGEGGHFTISDDAHCPARVGLNYTQLHQYLQAMDITELHALANTDNGVVVQHAPEALTHPFWSSL